MLIDSNIIIYAAQSEHHVLREFVAKHAPVVSSVSYVEVLGFHQLDAEEKLLLEAFFSATMVLPISQPVLDQAVHLRQQRRMLLGDALVAASAIVYHHSLATRNVKDFAWIDGLHVLDPLAT